MMKKSDFNIMDNIQSMEELKAQLLCVIGDFFMFLTKGSNAAKNKVLSCISDAIIILYLLGDKLGYSGIEIDEDIKRRLKLGVVDSETLEQDKKDLTKLYSHIKNRE